MKTTRLVFATSAIAAILAISCWQRTSANEHAIPTGSEYLTIRWAGREYTHVVRPGGKVEFIGTELRKFPRPERCDERSFYMNTAMNGLVKDGWEFAGMTSDEIVMRRPLAR